MPEDPASPPSLAGVIAGYLVAQRAGKPSPHTVKAHSADLAVISSRLADVLGCEVSELVVADLSAQTLRAAFAQFADTHAKASTVRAWSTWNRLCDFLVKDDIMTGNPMAAVPKPARSQSAPHAFTETDTARVLAVTRDDAVPGRNTWPTRDFAILATLVTTGLRANELLGLRLGDVEGNAGERQIAVHHAKGDKYRSVPMPDALEPILTDYLQQRWRRQGTSGHSPTAEDPWNAKSTLPLWVDHTGEALTIGKLEYLVRRAYKSAGINGQRPAGALIHALRHTFATRLVENGVSSVEVMHLLGHADLQTTQRYVATRPDHLRSAVAANTALQAL